MELQIKPASESICSRKTLVPSWKMLKNSYAQLFSLYCCSWSVSVQRVFKRSKYLLCDTFLKAKFQFDVNTEEC